MKRRDFTAMTAAAAGWGGALLAGLPRRAAAQGGPVEGRHYVRLPQAQHVQAGEGRIEVIEFFWYGCPSCFAFEPVLNSWIKRAPADVAFRRVHVALTAPYRPHQRLYYTLEALGREAELRARVFNAIHRQRQPLGTPEAMADFVAANGVDRAQFLEMYQSMGVNTACNEASRQSAGYKIDAVPALGVNGRYFTSASLVSHEDMLAVVDWLLARLRKGA